MSEEELSLFCDNVIKHHIDFLFNNFKFSGKNISFENIITPRKESETSIDYLSRIILDLIKEQIEVDKDLLKKSATGLFTDYLNRDIINAGESQRKLYESMLPFQKELESLNEYANSYRLTTPSLDKNIASIRIPENPIDRTNDKLDRIITYQTKLGPVIEASSNLLTSMHNIGMDYSKKSSRKTNLIIFISVITLFATLIISYFNYKTTIANSIASDKYMSMLIEETRSLNNNMQKYHENIKSKFDNIEMNRNEINRAKE